MKTSPKKIADPNKEAAKKSLFNLNKTGFTLVSKRCRRFIMFLKSQKVHCKCTLQKVKQYK